MKTRYEREDSVILFSRFSKINMEKHRFLYAIAPNFSEKRYLCIIVTN